MSVDSREKFDSVFSDAHTVLPAIHASTLEQVLENLQIVSEEGAKGFMLVNNDILPNKHLDIYEKIQDKYPHLFYGLNVLGRNPDVVLYAIKGMKVDGLRVDNPMIAEVNGIDKTHAIEIAKQETGWKGLYFGGVAFKYQPKIEIQDLPHAIKIAKSYLDVITTSGSATGRAANPTEVKFMREFSGNHPLALASGVQPENIHDYIKDIDISIVGTGISKDFHHLDPMKLHSLLHVVEKYNKQIASLLSNSTKTT